MSRLALLADDDLVCVAPPQLQRHPGPSDLSRPVRRAAKHVLPCLVARGAADFESRERLQPAPIANQREVAVTGVEVGDGIEGDRAGEQLRVLAD